MTSDTIPSPRNRWHARIVCHGLVVALMAFVTAACSDDPITPDPTVAAVGVVVGSGDQSLTIFELDDPTRSRTVGLGPDGSPVTLAVRGHLAAVPMGVVPALVVVDLTTATVLRTVGLPQGSGATGVAFANDSIVVVANPGLNTVSPVNVRQGTVGAQIPVGRYPQAVTSGGGRVFVLNGELEGWTPDGPSTVTVLDASTLQVQGTVTLGGQNAQSGMVGADGRLYVLNSGNWGADDGSLSVVDPATRTEISHQTGFGDFPGALASGPDGLYVTSFSYGLAVWSPIGGGTWVRTPGAPGGSHLSEASGVGVDPEGRVYLLHPDCQSPSRAVRLGAAFQVDAQIPVGICPLAIGFGVAEEG